MSKIDKYNDAVKDLYRLVKVICYLVLILLSYQKLYSKNICFLITDNDSIPISKASVMLFSTSENKVAESKISNSDGLICLDLSHNIEYMLYIQADGYKPYQQEVTYTSNINNI